jgi:phosphatidylserine/phosphatidylglycerophosphate/cardiolipin synthase-like enzyme
MILQTESFMREYIKLGEKVASLKTKIKLTLLLFSLWWVFSGCVHAIMPLPEGIDYQSKEYCVGAENIDFLSDLTYKNAVGETVHEQEIFDTIFTLIDNAREYILIDMFLFNSYTGKGEKAYRRLCSELMSGLINKKKLIPSMKIDFITDPVNNVYGGVKSKEIDLLKEAGINVIYTNLRELRDSNLLYSPIWRLFIQWFGNSDSGGIFRHPFSEDDPGITLRSYLALLNYKANHRKVILADNRGKWTTVITSANPHDGSSAHSNIALKISGDFGREIYTAEKSVAAFSMGKLHDVFFEYVDRENSGQANCVYLSLVTEKKIEEELIQQLESLGPGDSVFMALFYLSHRNMIKALLKAAEAGVNVKIILDPSKDAFGREKNGIPNQPVAYELTKKSHGKIRIRWYHTHGEQFHTKLTLIEKQDGTAVVVLGSANLTRKNIENFNLELNAKVVGNSSALVMQEIKQYYDRVWHNKKGHYTVDYSFYEDRSFMKTFLYRLYESTGISTF